MTDSVKAPLTLADLRAQRDEILAIAMRYKAANVRVFGSVARGDATPESDVDVIVSFHAGASLLDHSGLRLDLIDLLGVGVDVVSDHPRLKDSFRRHIEREAVVL